MDSATMDWALAMLAYPSTASEVPMAVASSLSSFFIVFTTTLVLVPRGAWVTRLMATLALGFLTNTFCNTLMLIFSQPGVQSDVVSLTWIAYASASEEILVSRIDAAQLSEGRTVSDIILAYRALCLFFNMRRVGTRWQISGIRPRVTRGRVWFLLGAFTRCTISYLLAECLSLGDLPEARLVTVEKQTAIRFWILTAEDVVFRLAATVMVWTTTYIFQTWNVGVAAFIGVLFGLSTPESWPRVFGPLKAMDSVRGFWGSFWHQALRKTLTGWSGLVTDKILRIPRGTLSSRYTRLMLAFLLSGILHEFQDRIFGVPRWELSSVKFFCSQGLGIMLEDAVQAMTKSVPIPRVVRRIVGHVWVVVFLCMTTPMWMFPKLRMGGDQGDIVPFPIVKTLLGRE